MLSISVHSSSTQKSRSGRVTYDTEMHNFKTTHSFRTAQLYFRLFLLLVVPLSIGYAVYMRTPEDFLSYGGAIAAVLYCLVILWLPLQHLRMAIEQGVALRRPPLKYLAIFLVGAATVSMLAGLMYYSLAVVLIDAWSNLKNWEALIAQRPSALAVGMLAVLTAGMLFFWFRLRARFIYGASEILAGISFAVHRLGHQPVIAVPSDDSFYFALLTAGVYLIVRGLDNMHQAWKDQSDPLAKFIFRLGMQSDLIATPPRRLKSSRMQKKARRYRSQLH